MSAIAGLWRFGGRPDAADGCAQMLAAQQIYGPHHRAQRSDLGGALAIGRNLFRLLPEDKGDAQPLADPQDRYMLVADVRIDNRDELAAMLSVDGRAAAVMTDAQFLFAALLRWGEAAVVRLYGEFAFALWDAVDRRLTLARDALGARPLHYHGAPDFIAFASMPKGLHALAEIPRRPDPEAMARSIVGLADPSHTYFEGVSRVEAGSLVVIEPNKITARHWWSPPRGETHFARTEDCVAALRDELDGAVRRRLRGETCIATHLSAGYDSGAVTATVARQLSPNGRVVAFTAVPRSDFAVAPDRTRITNEGPLAAQTAALYPNVEHVLIDSGDGTPLDALDRNFFLYEQPLPNLCNGVWSNAINDAVRARHIRVLMGGSLGNLTISYAGWELLPELFGAGRLGSLLREWYLSRRKGYGRLRGAAYMTAAPFLPHRLWTLASRMRGFDPDPRRHMAINSARFAALRDGSGGKPLDVMFRPARDGFTARLLALTRTDFGTFNKGTLAGWGIDCRDPTVDRRVIEFCLQIPPRAWFRDGEPRALARLAWADRLPGPVISEKRRGLQAADWGARIGLAGDRLAAEIESIAACDAARQVLDVERMRALARNWPDQDWHRPELVVEYRLLLLRAISAGHFLRRAAGANG